ncbi:MAG TPA: EAL domain-containing protein [Thermoanaerobaculia bacterium]|jgi:diguanylate cyclase (GGDEF)-like protein|nr:EAL domain-containing protein [Thermoanaerobaculia bacterium]
MSVPPSAESDPFLASPLPLFVADEADKLVAANAAFADVVKPRQPAIGTSVLELLGCADTNTPLRDGLELRVADGAAGSSRSFEVRCQRRDDHGGRRLHAALVEITDRERLEATLRHAADHDHLTGLPRPRLLLERIEQALAHSHRQQGYGFAVLFLDLDRFKVINDSHGHAAGDALLVAAVERLRGSLRRAGDAVARLGGDEFAILLDDVPDGQHAMRLAEAIQAELRKPYLIGGNELFTDSSVGVVLGSPRYADAGQVIRDADTAMYRAKAAGKGRLELFDQQMHDEALISSRLELELRAAVEHGEFEMHYQPIVATGSAEVIGIEALLRWRRADGRLVLPSTFLELAEETGLIVRIGAWALQAACEQAQIWRRAGLQARVTVNLSPLQFRQRDLAATICRVLEQTAVDPSALELEVTEGAVLEDPGSGIHTLSALRALGVRLSVDDFGTGCFSLSHLKRLPVDTLKIDESLIHDLPRNSGDAAIAKAVIDLGHSLGMEVIGEGVEGVAQLSFLRAHGCDALQGYYFEHPRPWPDLRQLLRASGEGHGADGNDGPLQKRLAGRETITVAAVDLPPDPPRADRELEGVSVLVVEDESPSRMTLAALLELAGAEVSTATTAAEALDLLPLRRPDVLVSDIGLPDVDGYALLRQVRALPRTLGGRVPAVALTGHARSEDRITALHAGFQMHVAKPVQPAELIAVVASLARGRLDATGPRAARDRAAASKETTG